MDAVSDAGWVRPPATAAELRRDVWLAVALGAGSLLTFWLYDAAGFYDEPAPIWVSVPLLLFGAGLIAVRRRFPLIVALLSAAQFMAVGILHVPEVLVTNITLFISLYTAGAWSSQRLRSMLVRGFIIAVMFGWIFVMFATQGTIANWMEDRADSDAIVSPGVAFGLIGVLTNLLYFAGAYWFGERAWAAARERARTAALTAELTAAQERTQAQAIALERVRIARELHDVVAHHVSVMGVQAGAARMTMGKDPEAAAAALSSVESSARAAVDELHQLLSTLRDEDTDDGPSVRRIDQLGALVADATSDRLPIEFGGRGRGAPPDPAGRADALPGGTGGDHQHHQARRARRIRRRAAALPPEGGRAGGDRHRLGSPEQRHRDGPAGHAGADVRGRRLRRVRTAGPRRLPGRARVPA